MAWGAGRWHGDREWGFVVVRRVPVVAQVVEVERRPGTRPRETTAVLGHRKEEPHFARLVSPQEGGNSGLYQTLLSTNTSYKGPPASAPPAGRGSGPRVSMPVAGADVKVTLAPPFSSTPSTVTLPLLLGVRGALPGFAPGSLQ